MLITQYDCIEFVKVECNDVYKASTTGRNPFSTTMPIGKPARSSDSQAPPPDTSFTTSGIQKHQDDVVIA